MNKITCKYCKRIFICTRGLFEDCSRRKECICEFCYLEQRLNNSLEEIDPGLSNGMSLKEGLLVCNPSLNVDKLYFILHLVGKRIEKCIR